VSAFLSYLVHGLAVGCGFALIASGLIIIYRVTRVVEGAGVVELRCLDAPTTIYVAKKDLHLYFVGRRSE